MAKTTALVSLFVIVILTTILPTSARPTQSQALSRQKRQSDQRLAELETLLALQKYGRHRFRMDRKKGVGADGDHPPGYGIIDFRMLGRKKKSTRFSPGELENSVKQISISSPGADADEDDRRSNLHVNQPDSYWTSDNNDINDNNNKEESSEPLQKHGQKLPGDQIGDDLNQPEVVPLFYLQNK